MDGDTGYTEKGGGGGRLWVDWMKSECPFILRERAARMARREGRGEAKGHIIISHKTVYDDKTPSHSPIPRSIRESVYAPVPNVFVYV